MLRLTQLQRSSRRKALPCLLALGAALTMLVAAQPAAAAPSPAAIEIGRAHV